MHGVELCQRCRCSLGRRAAGCQHVEQSLMALLKPLSSTRMAYKKTHGNTIGTDELLLSKSLSSQLVLLQLHSGQMLHEHVRREPPNRRE